MAALASEAAHVDPRHDVLLTGVGMVPAAMRLTQAVIGRDRANLTVISIGTAGAVRDLVGLHEVGTVVNRDATPELIRQLGCEPDDTVVIDPALPTTVATGDGFVADVGQREHIAGFADLVDMEGFAVAWVCRELGVPLRMAKHVSDAADEAALDWAATVDSSARELAAWVETVSRQGADHSLTGNIDHLPAVEFASPGPLRDALVTAILAGEKTTTSSLHADYRAEAEPLPKPGDVGRVIDSAGRTVGVMETTAVDVVPIADVTLDFAQAEGEGFTTVAQWRAAHEDFWGRRLADDELVVCQSFRLRPPE